MSNMRDAMRKVGFEDRQQPRSGERSAKGQRRDRYNDIPVFPERYFSTNDRGQSYLDSAFVSKKKVDALAKNLAKRRLTTGQIRRFFNHCRKIEQRLKIDGDSWEQVSAKFESLCYHAQNATEAGKIPSEFCQFINDNVERVVSSQNPRTAFLDGFLPHFEALVGFGSAHLKKVS